jgi:hypothetical protein
VVAVVAAQVVWVVGAAELLVAVEAPAVAEALVVVAVECGWAEA